MMMRLNKTVATGLMVIGLGMASLPSYAQGAPDGAPRDRAPLTAEQIAKFEKEKASRDAKLHDQLKITAAQEDAWKAYLQSTSFPHPRGEKPPRKEDQIKLTTPERLERQLEWMKKGQAHLVERIAATKALYAILTTEQQQMFDAHSARMDKKHGKPFRHGGPRDDKAK
jgi:protein CpxP